MRYLTFVAAALLLSGCATILDGRHETIEVTSPAPGSTARIDCANASVSSTPIPARLQLPRKARQCKVTIAAPGGADQTIELKRVLNTKSWWNAGFGIFGTGITYSETNGWDFDWNPGGVAICAGIPMLIDYATGAMYKHVPARIEAK